MKFSAFGWLGLAFVGLASCHSKNHSSHTSVDVKTTTAWVADTVSWMPYVGQIRSSQHIELRAMEKGFLQKIFVDEGQFVRKGQVLFQLMPAIQEAEVEKAAAEMEFAQLEYQNTQKLAANQVVSKSEEALAKAKWNQAVAAWKLAKAHLGFTTIRAPFDGLIGRFLDVRLGSLIEEGDLLTTLSDNQKMWVYFNMPESEYLSYAAQNKSQKPVQVELTLANQQRFDYPGKIETLASDFHIETGNIAFRATFPNPKSLLRNGETGTVLLPVRIPHAILIPQSLTFDILDKKYVYVVKNGHATTREIQIASAWPHVFAVKSGISVSDTLVADGLRKVKNGLPVRGHFQAASKIIADLHHLEAE